MQRWLYDHVPRGAHIHLTGPYNVPLDAADYVTTQSYGGEYPRRTSYARSARTT